MLKGKKIIVGITGSIAAYKAATLVRLLIKAGAEVQVIMTNAATRFITPLTLSVLSKKPVLIEIIAAEEWNNHVILGRWADAILISPASANTIAKMAQGICDNLLQAVYLSAVCPVFVAPAMDEDMWHHAATKNNIETLQSFGNILLPVENGELASGLHGEGRMAEPENIFNFLANYFQSRELLKGKKVLVTAGPTYEPIDPVRFIGNYSSGKMGAALAQVCASMGADVSLVMGPSSIIIPPGKIRLHRVQTAGEMHKFCMKLFPATDIAIMAAAVADYRPLKAADKKIKKTAQQFIIELAKTDDILLDMGKKKKKGQLLIGFALETNDEKKSALEKLKNKNLDMIVLNSLNDKETGFGYDTNKVTIFDSTGKEQSFPLQSKFSVAGEIVKAIINLKHA
jgi:phosphopantothenoylcysteine decarboxylase / phosphopantothenate---cysteine ligase